MLEKLNKVAPYLALVLLGYLGYSATEVPTAQVAQGKEPPTISSAMLNIQFVEPRNHASPVERDPFDVEWSSYRQRMDPQGPSTQPARHVSTTSTAPTSMSTSVPAQPATMPALPIGKVSALIMGNDAQYVVIEERIYKKGDTIRSGGPSDGWVVERIGDNGVVLRFGNIRRTLRLQVQGATETKSPRAAGGGNR